MKEIILIKDGEIALKGLNRRQFEDRLIKNIKGAIKDLGQFEIKSAQSTIYITPLNDSIDLDDVCDRVSRVFGIAAFSRAAVCPEKTLESVLETAPVGLKNAIKIEVSDRYTDGTFDSINKIKAVEEICDVEILNLA